MIELLLRLKESDFLISGFKCKSQTHILCNHFLKVVDIKGYLLYNKMMKKAEDVSLQI